MKWFKRFSNGLLALIIVAALVVIVFVATVLIVPKVRQNYAADGFFTALFKDPPKDEEILVHQNPSTHFIELEVLASTDYKKLQIKAKMVVTNDEHKYTDDDVVTYVDEYGATRKEEFVFTFENVKKGSNISPDIMPLAETTYKNQLAYELLLEVIYYK